MTGLVSISFSKKEIIWVVIVVDLDFKSSVENCGPAVNSIVVLDSFGMTVRIGTFVKIANRSAKREALQLLPRNFTGQLFKLLKTSALIITRPPSCKYLISSRNSVKPAPCLWISRLWSAHFPPPINKANFFSRHHWANNLFHGVWQITMIQPWSLGKAILKFTNYRIFFLTGVLTRKEIILLTSFVYHMHCKVLSFLCGSFAM